MQQAEGTAEDVRQLERRRIRSLVARDVAVASDIIADDFQLIAPSGMVFSKAQYLGAVEAGILHYIKWDVTSAIEVRLYGDIALIRYQADIEIEVEGKAVPAGLCWFTDAYEVRNGKRQIVWSQGTRAAVQSDA